MKRFIAAICLMGWVGWGFSQIVTVIDQETGRPLEFVTLISQKPNGSAITDSRGQTDLSPFRGSDQVLIRSLGYEPRVMGFDEVSSAGFIIELQPAKHPLEEVMVSATRWRQSSSNISSKIISIPDSASALVNPQTAADLLGISGKVFIQKSQQGGGSPMIRGFATNRLVYTIDGVRMNTAIFRSGNLQNVINLDPFAMEGTEVLFGPGSVIYGSDAIGGVMGFQTLRPRLSHTGDPMISGNAVYRYMSANNEMTGHFDVNVGWERWSLVTSFSSWDFGHLRQGSHGPDDYIKDYYVRRQNGMDLVIDQDDPLLQVPTGYSQVNLMQKIRFRPNRSWDLQYGFHFSQTTPYGRYDRHNRTRNGAPRYAEWNYGPQGWMMNHLNIEHNGNHTAYDQVILRLALQNFSESRISRELNQPYRNIREEEVAAWSANLDFLREMGSRNSLFYGLEFVLNGVESAGTVEQVSDGNVADGPDRYPQSSWYSMALYLDDEFRVTRQLTMHAGIRYNYFVLQSDFSENLAYFPLPFRTAEINNGALTGSLGGVYRPGNSWVFRASIGTAFRSPNVDDIGKVFDSEPGAVVVPNPSLEAEYAYNADVGVARVFGDWLKLDLTGYYTMLQNAMVRRDFLLDGRDSIFYDGTLSRVQAIQNASSARVWGFQAGMVLTLPAGLTFTSDLNFQRGMEEMEDGSTSPSRHAAPLFGTSRLEYQTGGLTLQLRAYYQAGKEHEALPAEEQEKTEIYALDSNGNTYAPGWYTLNLDARYRLSEAFSLGAGVENLTDRRYRSFSSGISGPGRNIKLSFRVAF